jgi:hypothetical protein
MIENKRAIIGPKTPWYFVPLDFTPYSIERSMNAVLARFMTLSPNLSADAPRVLRLSVPRYY